MKHFFVLLFVSISFVISAQTLFTASPNIVVDQFGYNPHSKKIAIIRNPKIGYDAQLTFKPSSKYVLYDAQTNKAIYKSKITSWKNGQVDSSSGDQVWYFDFSSITKPGSYYVADKKNKAKSYSFDIKENVYKDVLKQVFKSFYYQRCGFEKTVQFAGEGWADKASHVGPLQDKECREWGKANDASTAKDVSGGWYDAGDFNKYTNWTCDYINYMLLAYEENPQAWTDDFNIPESGNGIPDVLDEVRFGLEHVLRLQFANGSLIAIVAVGDASPPSSSTAPSFWGGPSTSATLSAAASFAYGSRIFKTIDPAFSEKLAKAAIMAFEWADKNPSVLFYNNSKQHGTEGLGAGQQEVDDISRIDKKLMASIQLSLITQEPKYKEFFEQNYTKSKVMAWKYVFPFGEFSHDMLLYYTNTKIANPTIVKEIKDMYEYGVDTTYNLFAIRTKRDPYFSFQKDYDWGSMGIKAKQASIFYNLAQYKVMPEISEEAKEISELYVHYFHGANPVNKCYITNMGAYGAENSVRQIYHLWFKNGSPLWDEVGVSKYGPAPGFLTGGPNINYDWDWCCPKSCGSDLNNSWCFTIDVKQIQKQPAQKSYMDFNQGWPLNSWSVSENSNGYQTQYMRLLSKFVK